MSDKMTQYQVAFYGVAIPASQIRNIQKPFKDMVDTISKDIRDYAPNASEDAVKAGLLEALRYMNIAGETLYPDLYMKHARVATAAFRYAIAAVNGRRLTREQSPEEKSAVLEREKEATRQKLEEKEKDAKRLEKDSPISAQLHREYQKLKTIYLNNGEEVREAKVKAWMALVEGWQYQGGIDYMIVAHKIPTAEGIYNEIEVINTMKAHPQMSGMQRKDKVDVGMRINNDPWKGLEG